MINIEKVMKKVLEDGTNNASLVCLIAIAEQLQEQNIQLKRIADVQESKLAILRAKRKGE